ncbi:hypothetical protein B0H14DRAFT_2600837 [Mycena olivaceomarginata]|nr:hypothetical protein B0H14DRAFT_2600837 [Mycena olivaceomarginata]
MPPPRTIRHEHRAGRRAVVREDRVFSVQGDEGIGDRIYEICVYGDETNGMETGEAKVDDLHPLTNCIVVNGLRTSGTKEHERQAYPNQSGKLRPPFGFWGVEVSQSLSGQLATLWPDGKQHSLASCLLSIRPLLEKQFANLFSQLLSLVSELEVNYKINKTTLAESFNDIEPEVLNEPEVDEKRAVERRKIPRSFERVGVWRSQGEKFGRLTEIQLHWPQIHKNERAGMDDDGESFLWSVEDEISPGSPGAIPPIFSLFIFLEIKLVQVGFHGQKSRTIIVNSRITGQKHPP